jgi:hypothetical protein
VEKFRRGKDFRRAGVCYFESTCHGETERVEYWPRSREAAVFVPGFAFPAERPPSDQVSDTPPAGYRSVAMVQDELMAMPEWNTLARLHSLGTSVRLLEGNADELLRLLWFLTEDPRSMPLSEVSRQEQLDHVFEEVLRLLHNFVAAARSLVDHTRVLYQELYEEKGLFPEYKEEVGRRFVKNAIVQFVHDLRHLAQHVQLPGISYTLTFDRDSGLTRQLVLRKEDLLRLHKWKPHAKQYLETAPEGIDVSVLLKEYLKEIRDFYQWMDQRQAEIHAGDAAEVEKKQAEGRALLAQRLPGLFASGLKTWEAGVGSLQNIFTFAFSPGDWSELSSLDGDLVAWTDAALLLTERKFGAIPSDLVTRIKNAARNDTTGPAQTK